MIEVAQEGTVTGRMVASYGENPYPQNPAEFAPVNPDAFPFYASYSEAQYDPRKLRDVARQCAAWFRAHAGEYDAVVLHGKSGLSVGFATAMLVDLPIVVVRKDGENSHGGNIEAAAGLKVRKDWPFRWVLLDDFIASGATLLRVAAKLRKFMHQRHLKEECIGVLQWQVGDMSGAACRKNWSVGHGYDPVPAFEV